MSRKASIYPWNKRFSGVDFLKRTENNRIHGRWVILGRDLIRAGQSDPPGEKGAGNFILPGAKGGARGEVFDEQKSRLVEEPAQNRLLGWGYLPPFSILNSLVTANHFWALPGSSFLP